jgi:hypothetical protein
MADLTVRDLDRAAQRQHRIYSRSPFGGTVGGDATNNYTFFDAVHDECLCTRLSSRSLAASVLGRVR